MPSEAAFLPLFRAEKRTSDPFDQTKNVSFEEGILEMILRRISRGGNNLCVLYHALTLLVFYFRRRIVYST